MIFFVGLGLCPPIYLFLVAIIGPVFGGFNFLEIIVSFVFSIAEFLFFLFILIKVSRLLYKLIEKNNTLGAIIIIILVSIVILTMVMNIYTTVGVGGDVGKYNYFNFFKTQLF